MIIIYIYQNSLRTLFSIIVRLSFLDHIFSAHPKERDVQAKRMTIRELREIEVKAKSFFYHNAKLSERKFCRSNKFQSIRQGEKKKPQRERGW